MFKIIEFYEFPFYIICKKCNNPPEIILSDREKLVITCNKCGIYEEEKIENAVNYSSKWVTNEIIFKQSCLEKHSQKEKESLIIEKKKISETPKLSYKYCKKCNLFLCEECLIDHAKEEKEVHIIVELYKFKANWCNIHDEKITHFCHQDKQNICKTCYQEHKTHYIERYEIVNKDKIEFQKKFEKFISSSEEIKKEKLKKLEQNIIWLQNFSKDDKESKEELNNTLNKLFEIFCHDLKIEINLVFFAKLLFATCSLFEEEENQEHIIKQYKSIIEVIKKYFEIGKVEEFNELLSEKKKQFVAFANRLTKEELNQLNTEINRMFEVEPDNISDFDKTKNYIQNNIEYSSMIKRYIAKEKAYHPENYVKIDEVIDDIDNLGKDLNSDNSDYVLSLIGKSIENNGIEMNISKKKDENFKKIELASIQSIFTLGNQKKYDLHFDFGDEINKTIVNNKQEKDEFIKKYKSIIAKQLEIDEKNIILTDIQKGSVTCKLSIMNSGNNNLKYKDKLNKLKNIKDVEEKPLLESLQISPEILDKRGDRSEGWGIGEKRGGEDYIPPINGWNGIGLKVWGQYDNGNNDWLSYNNNSKEYAIAYLGLSNCLNNVNSMVKDLNTITDYTINKLYENDIDYRKSSLFGNLFGYSKKCGEGICLFKDPEEAAKYASIVKIPGIGIYIQIMLMCRVKPSKIREPTGNRNCWILNPTPEEIRPYRILIKEVPISSLAQSAKGKIIVSLAPEEKLLKIIQSKNYSFYSLSEDKAYSEYAYQNGQKLNNDNFVMRFYTSNEHRYLNDYLRSEKIDKYTEDQIQSLTCCLQLALNRNKGVEDDTIVYRGISNYRFPEEIKIGTKFYFKEFISTTTNKSVALSFKKQGGTFMKITIKNNKKKNYCYFLKQISMFEKEDEILISSLCLYTITNIERNIDGDFVEAICEGFLFPLE